MADRNLKPDDGLERTVDLAPTYRCVCGELVWLGSGSGLCARCGRRYDLEVLRQATAETMIVPVDGSPSAGGQKQPSTDSCDELIGRRLGHFHVLAHIGHGGMGSVYRALDESLQRYVAIKLLRGAADRGSETDLERLFHEARAQARVNHPHVAHIYYVGTDAETPYLAMELVGHSSLADRLRNGPLPFALIVRYARQIAQALDAAAKFDIVHGDVKPANVLLVDELTVKLSDFGLARRVSEVKGDGRSYAGTPDFMPPEATQGRPIDHRGDMYSLGVTLFQLSFSHLPYASTGNKLSECLRAHREASIEFPEPWPRELPRRWRDVLAKLLEKEPDQRYPDFPNLIAQLRRLEPATLPNASPMLRGLAWLFDSFLLALPLMLVAIVFSVGPLAAWRWCGIALAAAIPAGICLIQAWWATTPGKELFQICIVDHHGLTPHQPRLAARAAFQFCWAWAAAIQVAVILMPLSVSTLPLNLLVFVFLIVELGATALRNGRSIHDQLLQTRVVLDVATDRR